MYNNKPPFDIQGHDFKDYFNYLVLNLKVIERISPNDKISSKNNNLAIDSPSIFQGFIRWWNESDRKKGIDLVDKFIKEFKTIELDLVHKKKTKLRVAVSSKSDKNTKLINNYLDTIKKQNKNLINGLDNLQKTYEGDTETYNKINSLKEYLIKPL